MILITGAGGYIGRHLAAALRGRDEPVRALDLAPESLAPLAALGAEPVVADACDAAALRQALAGARVVYHLAGSALGDRAAIWRANAGSAETLAELCAGLPGLKALVYASSGALYPSGPGWLDEATPPAPAFPYARAKHAAEQALLDLHRRKGLPVQVARIAAVYGPGSPALMADQVRRGRFPLIGGGRGYASNIHIEDLVAALLAMPERGRPGRVYNLADDEPAPVAAFYGRLARLLGAPPPPSISPAAARALVWLVGAASRLRGRPSPLPADLVAMAGVSHRMANGRMRDELGLRPRYPSYIEGLPAALGLD
ncbi:MAG TPA: NAD-dependent epimerase/dehydratase family protein [Chloroflexaceae bacterium]|nr:NAD-dependent epimerase/dehydratase family protein [Chloroflexaceae bacterium]